MPASDFQRIRAFDTILNFRDFGGYATRDGREVATGKLFRSAHLHRLSEADAQAIGDLGIELVVDLRHAPERARQPSRFWAGGPSDVFELRPQLDDEGEEPRVAPHEAFLESELHAPEDARRYMLGSYGARPDDAQFRDIFLRTLRHMNTGQGGVLVHCAAGKDRTGTLAALILLTLGVPREVVMEDFLLTLEAVDIEAMLPGAAKMFSDRFGREVSPDAIRPMFGVEPGYLEASLATMGAGDGDVTAYLDGLGFGADARAKLRSAYLVGD